MYDSLMQLLTVPLLTCRRKADMVHASLAGIRVVIYPAEFCLLTVNPAKSAVKFELIYIPASKLIPTFAT